jgi:hypothetical protein
MKKYAILLNFGKTQILFGVYNTQYFLGGSKYFVQAGTLDIGSEKN